MVQASYKQLLKFGAVGGAATAIHVAVFMVLTDLVKLSYVQSNFVAYTVATLWAFAGNTLWSFGCKPSGYRFLRYTVVALLGLLFSMGISWACEAIAVNAFLTICLIVICVTPTTFLLHRFWTFAKGNQ